MTLRRVGRQIGRALARTFQSAPPSYLTWMGLAPYRRMGGAR